MAATVDPEGTHLARPGEGGMGRGAIVGLVLLSIIPSMAVWLVAAAVAPASLSNDFHSYWYAGRLLAQGSSPYDLEALRAFAVRQGDDFLVGTGFSYPLPFAFAMIPLLALPFDIAVVLFDTISAVVFAAALVGWLRHFHAGASPGRLRLAALLAGTFPPLIGSILNGQANLLVGATLLVGAALVLERFGARSAIGGIVVGLATVVKLVPGALVLPLWLAGRRHAAVGIVAGFLVPLGLAAATRPSAALDAGWLAVLFRPDPFVTNQSLNGFVSRLVDGTDRMAALAPGAFDPGPVVAILTSILAGATIVILWRTRRWLATTDGLALALALALVAATVGAPKTSFWNTALLLVAVVLLLRAVAPDLRLGALDRTERRLLFAWWATAILQPLVWASPPLSPGPGAALAVILGSLSLYGSLALWWLLVRQLQAIGEQPLPRRELPVEHRQAFEAE